jgi:hypothetical protein
MPGIQSESPSFVVKFDVISSTPIQRIRLIHVLKGYLSQKDNIIARATTTNTSFKLDNYDILIRLTFMSYDDHERGSKSYVSTRDILKLIPSILYHDNLYHLYDIPLIYDDCDENDDYITEYTSFTIYSGIYNKLSYYSSISIV